jgi:hypothetical protein
MSSRKLRNGLRVSFQAIHIHFETYAANDNINLFLIKCKNVSFYISIKNILRSGNVIIKVVTRKNKLFELSRIPNW